MLPPLTPLLLCACVLLTSAALLLFSTVQSSALTDKTLHLNHAAKYTWNNLLKGPSAYSLNL